MNTLVRNRKAYRQVFYDQEAHYEQVVKQQLPLLIPAFHVVEFTPYVLGDEGMRRRPDLALVHHDYHMWAVVEVELEHHSLTHHVYPQLQVFATGAYGTEHAEAILATAPGLDAARVSTLVQYQAPKILTIVNSTGVLKKDWGRLRDELGVQLTFLETFRSEDGDVIFAISGYLPEPRPERLTGAKKADMLNALTCSTPTAIPNVEDGCLNIDVDGRSLPWKVLRTADSVVLLPGSGVNLRADRNYEILRASDGRLKLRQL